MENQHFDFYQALRWRVRDWSQRAGKDSKWSEYVLLAPDLFHLLCKLIIDPDVPTKQKVKLAAAIAYFVSPLDLMPEALMGPTGYVDDVALSAYVLNSLLNSVDAPVLTRNWAGDGDLLEAIRRILKVADEMVGSGLWQRLKGLIR